MSTIHHTYGPHVDASYLRRVLGISYVPWKYVRGHSPKKLKSALREKFHAEPALFSSGREALLAVLKAMGLRSGEEVIVQGYTCVVVPNAIHAAGGVPVYADIDPETLNMNPHAVKTLITPRTRAIICQHTFGIPSDTKTLRAVCDEHHLVLIEDMAHVIPDAKGPAQIGALGDVLLLSFGRDKAISGISGGAAICRKERLKPALQELERTAEHLSWWKVMKLLEYGPRMYSVVRRLAGTPLLKPAIWLMNKMGFFAPVLTAQEKKGFMSPVLHRIPNACAYLANYSLSRLGNINKHRRALTALYLDAGKRAGWPMLRSVSADLPLQKFPLFVPRAEKIREILAKENIHLDDGWTGCVVCPDTVDEVHAGYVRGSDPHAEHVGRAILSLPTHPTMTMFEATRLAKRITELLTKA